MTDISISDNVTPLPVKAKRADNTAALRQRPAAISGATYILARLTRR